MRWAVIENAGYVGKCVIASNLTSYNEAYHYMLSHYEPEEIDSLHVDIAFLDQNETLSYDY